MSYSDYNREVTEASLEVLKQFLEITNTKKIYPTIIGGWATEAYHRTIGSKDIDIVVAKSEDIEKILEEKSLWDESGDEIQQGWPKKYVKKGKFSGEEKNIQIDIFNAKYPRQDYERLGITFDWEWTHKFREKRKIEDIEKRKTEDIEIFVPKRELLIITKMIAAVDRQACYDRTGRYTLRSKIWKDFHDVAILINQNSPDKEFLQEYYKKTNMIKYSDIFIRRYKQDEYASILVDLQMVQKDIEDFLS